MQRAASRTLYSPSDLVSFVGCSHSTTLDLRKLEGWEVSRVPADATTRLIQDFGDRHERAYLAVLEARGREVARIGTSGSLESRVAATRAAMNRGAEVIYQAVLLREPWVGIADFLFRVPGESRLGDFHYEVADTKLAKSNRAKFIVQLCIYADLLAGEQEVLPEHLHVILGDLADHERARLGLEAGEDHISKLPTADYIHYTRALAARFLNFVTKPMETQPTPVSACTACGWRDHCQAQWVESDHLSQVAGIRSQQIVRLEAAGVTTMRALAAMNGEVKGIGSEVLERLKLQARLQCDPRAADGQLRLERLALPSDVPPAKPTGFTLLPEPAPGDLYFDMEGFPHEPGGLEYLFGVGYFEAGDRTRWTFKPFWAHDRPGEKRAFECFMDFVEQHLVDYPRAHIYHYAAYERTAIQKLSSLHDTRVEFRDRLLREGRLVDLYRVVSSALRLALPSYSIKKVEAYYRSERQGEVADAGASIVQYEAFRKADDAGIKAQLLNSIEAYNRDDVESTQQLHDWLERLRPDHFPRPVGQVAAESEDARPENQWVARQRETLDALDSWARGKTDAGEGTEATRLAEIMGQSLGFYWRCKLPGLWRKFERQTVDEATLIDDPDCLALLTFTGDTMVKDRSTRYRYRVPEQLTRIGTGDMVQCLTDSLPASNFEFDEAEGVVSFTRRTTAPSPPPVLTLVLNDNVSTDNKLRALYRFADRLCADQAGHDALSGLLVRRAPRLAARPPGSALTEDLSIGSIIRAVGALDHSHLVIQGPPGTGKTTLAATVIAALLRDGKRVAVSSNSHAAINHLLEAAVRRCEETGVAVRAVVVKHNDRLIPSISVISEAELDSSVHTLVGGTSFLLCRPEQVGRWDYLFIDEASQVSLADVIAAGPCARNIVLLGDQMQLPQPIQGIHPGDSGLSVLDYLMQGRPTVPADEGIFLATTYRMHPDVCKPLSEGIYEGRLQTAPNGVAQGLVLRPDADPALRATGIVHIPVEHHHRSQSCPEEVTRIEQLYRSLLQQSWINPEGITAHITEGDVVVLAAYNAQVRSLQKALGPNARVGTVDKFQGQEAVVAVLSMTSSDAESIPRGLGFLFSRHRMNVAVSRARCLAIIVASPSLGDAYSDSIDDLPQLSFYARLTQAAQAPADSYPPLRTTSTPRTSPPS